MPANIPIIDSIYIYRQKNFTGRNTKIFCNVFTKKKVVYDKYNNPHIL